MQVKSIFIRTNCPSFVSEKNFKEKKFRRWRNSEAYVRDFEASSLDQIKMTKNRLEFDQKNFTPMNVNIGT